MPLDADEFLTGENNPREILEKLSLDSIYYVTWRWYVMTKEDDKNEPFIPRRMKYCLTRAAWNYSDGTPVQKRLFLRYIIKKWVLHCLWDTIRYSEMKR